MKSNIFVKTCKLTIIFSALILIPGLLSAQVMTGGTYSLSLDSDNAGGVNSTSANYSMQDTIGEYAVGDGASTNYSIDAGYQQREQIVVTSSSGGGGGGGGSVLLAPNCSISAVDSSIDQGDTTQLLWSSTDSDAVLSIDQSIGSVSNPAFTTVSPITTTTYTMTAQRGGANSVCSTTIIVNEPASSPGFIQFTSSTFSGTEQSGFITIQLQRTGGSDGELSAGISFVSGTGVVGIDFAPTAQTVTWLDGETGTKTIQVPILSDSLIEADEIFFIQIDVDDPTLLGSQSQITATIQDTASVTPSIKATFLTLIADLSNISVDAATASLFRFTVGGQNIVSAQPAILSPDTPTLITANTVPDYVYTTIVGGSQCPTSLGQTVSLSEGDDVVCTVLVEKAADQDIVYFSVDSVVTSEDDGEVSIVISRSGPADDEVTLELSIFDGLAQAGVDFELPDDLTFVWDAGDTQSKTITIPILSDDITEGDESFSLGIKSISNGAVQGGALVTQVTISDSPVIIDGEIPRGQSLPVQPTIFSLLAGLLLVAIFAGSTAERIVAGGQASNIMVGFVGLRKKKPWGTAFDAKSGKHLDPVYVSLRNAKGIEIMSMFTDIKGRFGFVAPKGEYTISAMKTNYAFPSQHLSGTKKKITSFKDLYFGEKVVVKKDDELIKKNIPMDQDGEVNWNESEKEKKGMYKMVMHPLVAFLAQIIFYAGLVYSVYTYINVPTILNLILLGVGVLLLISRVFGLRVRTLGHISYRGKSLSGARITVTTPSGQVVSRRLTSKKGHYHILVWPGTYTVTVEPKSRGGAFGKPIIDKEVKTKNGVINKKLQA